MKPNFFKVFLREVDIRSEGGSDERCLPRHTPPSPPLPATGRDGFRSMKPRDATALDAVLACGGSSGHKGVPRVFGSLVGGVPLYPLLGGCSLSMAVGSRGFGVAGHDFGLFRQFNLLFLLLFSALALF